MGHRRTAPTGWYRSVTYVLKPTAGQTQRLTQLLIWQCRLYNAALEERRGAWRVERRSISLFDQINGLTGTVVLGTIMPIWAFSCP
jgi:hypothetical protein